MELRWDAVVIDCRDPETLAAFWCELLGVQVRGRLEQYIGMTPMAPGMPRLLPLELHFAYKRPPKTIPRVAGHHADWLQACKGGTPACSNFGYGARLTEFVLLGTMALRTGKVLKWDAANMKATNADVQPLLGGSYRKGWELPV